MEHPYSALKLRLALALFGLVVSCVGGFLVWRAGAKPIGIALFVLAALALVDTVVIVLRLRRG